MTGPFKSLGAQLLANGYQIVPIPLGDKRPAVKDWPNLVLSQDAYERMVKTRPHDGVGILTRNTPAVDIDVLNTGVATAMRAFHVRNFGDVAPLRIGKAPKALYVYRCEEPFAKMTSNSYIDPENPTKADGKKLLQRIEILGDGQQFVAFHTHPDTGKPYDWPGFDQNPLDLRVDELPLLTHEMALQYISEFERICDRLEWKKAASGSYDASFDSDIEVLAEDGPPTEEDDEISRVKSALAMISADCDRDTYLRILAAMKWTQWECSEDIAREWAESAPDAYIEKDFNHDWKTLKADRGGRKTATIATIYGMAKEAGWDTSRPAPTIDPEATRESLGTFLEKAAQLTENDSIAVRELLVEIRGAELDTLTHAVLFKEIAKRSKLTIPDVKRTFVETRVADEGMPTHWTYAKKMAAEIEDETGVAAVALEGQIWLFSQAEMVWKGRIPEMMSMRVAKNFDGGDNCERRGDYVAIAKQLHDHLASGNENFFKDAPIGMAVEKRFYSIGQDGEIERAAIAASHRQRVLFPVTPKVGEMPLFDRFLNETFAGNAGTGQRDLMQEIVGSTLLGFFFKYEKVVLMYGPGRAGKGTLMKIIEALVPQNVRASVPPTKWTQEYYLATLSGKRLNVVGEIDEEGSIDGAVLKTVSGRDSLTGRVPAGMPFEFTNIATHIFNSNYFPPTRDQSDAFFSRWVLINFKNSLLTHEEDIDMDLAEKIIADELPAVAAWAIKGAQRLIGRKKLALPPEHFELMNKWRKRSNSVIEFIHDRDECRLGTSDNHRVRRSEFYPAYAQWCRESGRKALGKQKVYELIDTPPFMALGVKAVILKGIDYFKGIMLPQSAFFGAEDDLDEF